ncbi:hypothetical protein F0U62_36870 [Cystobacter fuscus]|uniref:hypothetical protein n=1 Tax=Cystobacter fuscus TaxID=43 RepID=UPI002B319608|nr:hypothetical protein F0U62_36870 [Cystobacter fuscus]
MQTISRTFVTLVLGLPVLARAAEDDWNMRDTLLTEAAAVPGAGTVRVSAGGGLDQSDDGADSSVTSLGASLLWSPVTNLALGVSSQWQGGSFTPAASVRWQLLSEAVAPVNLTAFVRFRAVGMESTGSELDAKLAFGRTLGRVGLTGNVLVGKGLGHRGDVDFEASSLASYRLTSAFRTGIEGRVHFELVDEFKTPEDRGRPFGLVVGPTASYVWKGFQLQGLVGWSSPRGSAPTGVVAQALATFDF